MLFATDLPLPDVHARFLGNFNGMPVYEYPVVVKRDANGSRPKAGIVRVIAEDPEKAASLVWSEVAHRVGRPIDLSVVGPAGETLAQRSIGWSAMSEARCLHRGHPESSAQLRLF